MPTPEGLERVLAIAAGAVNDSLAAGTLTISDGEHTAAAQLDQAPEVTITENGARLRVVATFGEDAANFEWSIREFRSEGGVVIDRTEEDQGRKAPGAVWTLEADIELQASS